MVPNAVVITLADTDPPPIGSIIATDQEHGFPVVITHTAPSPDEGAVVVAIHDIAPTGPTDPGDGVTQQQFTTHINAALPHPAYDDIPSLQVLFENGLI